MPRSRASNPGIKERLPPAIVYLGFAARSTTSPMNLSRGALTMVRNFAVQKFGRAEIGTFLP